MPDTIRTTVDSLGARPQQSGLLVVLTIAIAGSCFFAAGPAEAACAAVMGALVGNEPARDDIALLMVRRQAGKEDDADA